MKRILWLFVGIGWLPAYSMMVMWNKVAKNKQVAQHITHIPRTFSTTSSIIKNTIDNPPVAYTSPFSSIQSSFASPESLMQKTAYYTYYKDSCCKNTSPKKKRKSKAGALKKKGLQEVAQEVKKTIDKNHEDMKKLSRVYTISMRVAVEVLYSFILISMYIVKPSDPHLFIAAMKYGFPPFVGIPSLIGTTCCLFYKYKEYKYGKVKDDFNPETINLSPGQENLIEGK